MRSRQTVVLPQTIDVVNRSNAILLPKTRAAFGKVRAGTGSGRILCIGDSTTMGYGNNGGTGDMKTLSWPTQLSNLLNNKGINAHANSFMGNGGSHGSPSTTLQWDPRLTAGSSWGVGVGSVGGASFTATTNTNALSFLPTVNVDTFVVYYISNGGLGTLSLDINGGTPVTQSTNAGASIRTKSITGTLGSNKLNIKWSSGSNVYVVGVEAYDSSKNWISVVNAGWDGSNSSDWTNTVHTYDSASGITLLAPDLTIFCLGINDWNTGVTPAAYLANMQIPITKALSVGDVVLMTPNPTNSATVATATQQGLLSQMAALAATNNIPLIDTYGRWVSYTAANAAGLSFDNYHPKEAGYADISNNIFNNLMA